MSVWKHYYLAQTIDDALNTLAAAPGPSCLVAGGTDLLLDLQQGRHDPVHTLVDVTHIPETTVIEVRNDHLYIGAAVPLKQIVDSHLVVEHAQALSEACALIGGPQVRNTATLGGNVAHALPAGDGTIALLALDAVAEVASLQGRRRIAVEELFFGPGRSALMPQQDLLLGFYLPLGGPGTGTAHRRVMRPQGVAIAILNMAAWIKREGDLIFDLRLSLGPAGPTPLRARSVEMVLKGQQLTAYSLRNANQALLNEAHFRTSKHRATSQYRHHLAGILLQDTLTVAWERAAIADTRS